MLMNNSGLCETLENVRKKKRYQTKTEKRRNYLLLEPNYYTKKVFR